MRTVKVNSNKFFVKKYNDGIVVSFLRIGSVNSTLADQIHNFVVQNSRFDLFATDIANNVSDNALHKSIICQSLYVFVDLKHSISGSGINVFERKDVIDVIFNSENVLSIKKKKTKLFWLLLLVIGACIWNYNHTSNCCKSNTCNNDNHNCDTLQEAVSPLCDSTVFDNVSNNNEISLGEIDIDFLQSEDSLDIKNQASIGHVDNPTTSDYEVVSSFDKPKPESFLSDDFIIIPKGVLKRYLKGYEGGNYIYEDHPLDSFYICKHEVTQKEFEDIMGYNPSLMVGDSLPVNMVQYIEAINYCNSRSLAEGYDGFYIIENNTIRIRPNSNGYRLPNKYEWAYAARKDEVTKTRYASGDIISKVAWYGGNSKDRLHPVCTTKEPNARGIYDMNGNVSEWLWCETSGSNCYIGSDFLSYIGFYEGDVYYKRVCDETLGFRVVLITRGQHNHNVDDVLELKYHKLEYYHAVEEKIKREKEETERERKEKALKTEANGYISQMISLYKDYCKSQNIDKLIDALCFCEKAIKIDTEYGFYFVSKKNALNQCRNLFTAIINGETSSFSTKESSKEVYKVGDYYCSEGKQGIVFYVTPEGHHGKIISIAQSVEPLQWSVDQNLVVNSRNHSGVDNMQVIQSIEGWHDKFPAFGWCSDLGDGWYLPSFSELYHVFNNAEVRYTLVSYLLESTPTWFIDNWDGELWTSTEANEFTYQALYCTLGENYGMSTNKNYTNYVRAVAEF